jgi:hypothetical protein
MILLNICEWVSVPDPDIVNCPLYVFASDVTVNAGTVSVQGGGITGKPRPSPPSTTNRTRYGPKTNWTKAAARPIIRKR